MKIITIHPGFNLNSSFVWKDMGYIGRFIGDKFHLKSEIWCFAKKSENNFSFEGQDWYGFRTFFGIIQQIIKENKNISIVQMFHISHITIFFCLLIKLLNNKIIILIKADSPLYERNRDLREKTDILPHFIRSYILSKIDIIAFEHKELLNHYISIFPQFKNRFIFGTSSCVPMNTIIGNLNKKKEICCVGRFGAVQKNYEMLIDVLSNQDCKFLSGRKINLCGGMTEYFEYKLNELYNLKPEFKSIIVKNGFITDREKLYKIMASCKIFLHTASWEGDPNIQYDSLFTGCYMISTDVSNIKQNYPEKYSSFYEIKDGNGLYKTLRDSVLSMNTTNDEFFLGIQKHFLNHMTWEHSLSQIVNKLHLLLKLDSLKT